MYSRGGRDGCRSECLGNQPGIESNMIMMESDWMQTKTVIWFVWFVWFFG
jgi:hypothetical protein